MGFRLAWKEGGSPLDPEVRAKMLDLEKREVEAQRRLLAKYEEREQNRLADTLKICDGLLGANVLRCPESQNAVICYQNVLKEHPKNSEALFGLSQVEKKYGGLGESALKQGQEWKAVKYINSILQINPNSKIAVQLEKKVKERRAKEQAKKAEKGMPQETSHLASSPQSEKSYTDPTTGMEFVWVPEGCFQMGNNFDDCDEMPVQEVCVDGFWLGKYEVTNAQYRRYKSEHKSMKSKKDANSLDGDHQPVVYVSWEYATEYGRWLSGKGSGTFRLPTEAEWEYVARARTQTRRYWGDGTNEACRYSNVYNPTTQSEFGLEGVTFPCEDGYKASAPVGKFRANRFGLHDMLGNVSEWTCSEYYEEYDGKEKGCASPDSEFPDRVYRGGSWFDDPDLVRSADRDYIDTSADDAGLGFRLLRTHP